MSFFDDKSGEDQEVSKIKLGELEFTQEELNELVGAGKKLKEIEEKQGQPVDDILKSWGRRGEEIGNYKKKVEELETNLKKVTETPPSKEELDEEQVKTQVINEAKKYGLLTKEEASQLMNDFYNERRSGEKLLYKAQRVLRTASKEGKPTTNLENLLQFMADPANPKDPKNAYDIMFKKELKDWEQKQLQTIKNKGMVTLTNVPTTKNPDRKSVNSKEALAEQLREHFTNYSSD